MITLTLMLMLPHFSNAFNHSGLGSVGDRKNAKKLKQD